jgi:hypothetical protein
LKPSVREFFEGEMGVKLPAPNVANEVAVSCPFHRDGKPSMSINLDTGMWKCFSCGASGDMYTLYEELHGVDFATAKAAVDKGDFLPTVPEEEVDDWNEALLEDQVRLKWLKTKRGITKDTVKKFRLGWNGSRITIPVLDSARRIVNVRMYKPNTPGKDKVISYKAGYGATRLFPLYNLDKKSVVLFEGEMDTLLGCDLGLPAIGTTGGAGTWKSAWSRFFTGKNVYICYDRDIQGVAGAAKVAKALLRHAKAVYVVELPIDKLRESGGQDFTDYIVTHRYSIQDFKQLLKATKKYGIPEKSISDTPTEPPVELHLSQASQERYFNRCIAMNVIVAGKDLAPYLVPKVVQFACSGDGGKKCEFCALMTGMGSYKLKISSLDPILLELVDCPSGQQKGILKELAGIPGNCKEFEYETVEAYNIEEVYLMPEIDFSTVDTEYVIRRAFYVGHGIRTNQSYHMVGITIPEPHRQYATHLINSAQPAKDDVAAFTLNSEVKNSLRIFRPSVGQTVSEKMTEIARDFTYNITHIYGREDLVIGVDLVYHSVISFHFQNKHILKGWNEMCVVGDTRTGKSETVTTMMQHYKMGEFITGENTSFAGLVGGMQQNQKRWSITWGKIPLNDRRLVAIDEIGSLSEDTIQRMSGIRSSGIAEITKIQTEKTHARTRLIMMGNPRNGKALSGYSFGVNALRELIGAPEDLARFDFAMACASSDVSLEVINAEYKTHDRVEHVYSSEDCNALVRWVWSRTPEQVTFGKGVEEQILQLAMVQGREYSNRVPLVEAANQRIKIAKLAIATAARLFSTDKTGECIVVKKAHVEFVGEFLDRIYRSNTLGYHEFSRQQIQNVKVAEESRDKVYKMMEAEDDLANIFLTYSHVRIVDLIDMLDCEREEAKHYLKELVHTKMLFKTQNGYIKSPAFTKILRELQSEMLKEE